MGRSWIYWLRWSGFLPGGILITILINLPIHWMVLLVTSGCPSPGSTVDNPLRLIWCILPPPDMLERLALALINPLGIVLFGSWIAPAHRLSVSIGLGGLLSVGLIGLYYMVFAHEALYYSGGPIVLYLQYMWFAHEALYYSGLDWLEFGFVVVLNLSGLLAGILLVMAANSDGAKDKVGQNRL